MSYYLLTILNYFGAHNVSVLASGSHIQAGFYVSLLDSLFFWAPPSFVAQPDVPGLSYTFSVLSLEMVISLRVLVLFIEK